MKIIAKGWIAGGFPSILMRHESKKRLIKSDGAQFMANGLMDKCLQSGIRMTSQRQIIVGVIEGSEDHPDVDQLYRRAVAEDTTISIATVYRTVKLLEEAGVIDRLEFGDGRARYEESGQHHEHLVDVETGEVIEFYHAELEALKEQIAREMGYELVDHRLELFGRKLKS